MNSKPCATCVEVTVAVLICAIIGACIFVSLHNVPTQKTVESHPTLNTATMSSSPMLAPLLVPIPVSTAPKPIKLVIVIPENHK